jgi:hypothetical protein
MPNTAGVNNLVDPQVRLIAVNGSAGAEVVISASVPSGYVTIQEWPLTPSSVLQGLSIQRADEDYVNTYPLPPGSIWEIGDSIRKNRCEGMQSFTYPDGVVRPATPWIRVISATANPTQVMVKEYRQQYNN